MNSTSITAFESIKPERSRLQKIILQGLSKIKKGSFRDIARASGLREGQVWKRLSELKQIGRITEVDTKICSISGRPVTVWKIIEE